MEVGWSKWVVVFKISECSWPTPGSSFLEFFGGYSFVKISLTLSHCFRLLSQFSSGHFLALVLDILSGFVCSGGKLVC